MTSLLGGLSPATFLAKHWQKEPLLVRQAIPGFRGLVSPRSILSLATRPDATSRLVIQHPRRGRPPRWERHDGPFASLDASMLPASRWTILVHGLESLVPGAWELLRRFSFIPAARIDDLMVSYATDGGGVGPHDDRYDVFLLQGPGRRRWQISRGGDRALDPDAAIKVLRRFEPEEEWTLEPGDMLYLPPGVAHHGVADGPCFTYSIGFLAPSHGELMTSFLSFLAGRVGPEHDDVLLADRQRVPARRTLELTDDTVGGIERVLEGIRWDRDTVEEFAGRFLTRPRPHVRFPVPRRPLSVDAFAAGLRAGASRRLTLALPSRGLVRGRRLFLNGESHDLPQTFTRFLEGLVLDRSVPLPLPRSLAAGDRAIGLLHDWYSSGWLTVESPRR